MILLQIPAVPVPQISTWLQLFGYLGFLILIGWDIFETRKAKQEAALAAIQAVTAVKAAVAAQKVSVESKEEIKAAVLDVHDAVNGGLAAAKQEIARLNAVIAERK